MSLEAIRANLDEINIAAHAIRASFPLAHAFCNRLASQATSRERQALIAAQKMSDWFAIEDILDGIKTRSMPVFFIVDDARGLDG